MLDRFRRTGSVAVDLVITLPRALAVRNHVAYFMGEEIADCAAEAGIAVHEVQSYGLTDLADSLFFASAEIDLLLVIGWERLLPDTVLRSLGKYALGMHGSPWGLPKGRGRSPMNWAILTGHGKFITYLFRLDSGIDDGAIIGMKVFDINAHDGIAELHAKNRLAMAELVETYLPLIARDEIVFWPQPPGPCSFYPKRSAADGAIDWHLPTEAIHRLIRAVAPPYPGASCRWREETLHVLDAQPFDTGLFHGAITPGTIVDLMPSRRMFVVKTGDGSLLVRAFDGVAFEALEMGGRLLGIGGGQTSFDDAYPRFVTEDMKEIRTQRISR
ncbi:methionyl-tRNA formyltransferase [Marinivivus vitaminiproducens]|uniref:methionyl-tRNA formyltransferase n=1 Tax=Marinivivus vitaminiproducens TaxID=3035935 RepID=UPI0027A645B6|nr:formyltransferase family protein [Geminicoccaceae bacterium SCSIO 64248]